MLHAFLDPDAPAFTRMLAEFPDYFHFPRQVVSDTLSLPDVQRGIQESATPTLRMLRDNHVFDEAEIAASFREKGFLV
jgi:hypothetical protein